MNITKELVSEVAGFCQEYDKEKDMKTRRKILTKIETAVDGLSDKQVQQLVRMLA